LEITDAKENKSYNALWQLYNSIRQYICALNDYAMIFCVSIFFSALPALWNAKPIPLGSAEKIYLFFANFASGAKRAVKKYSHLPA
jgi:hypothetical protein